jgi:hypothetical protein
MVAGSGFHASCGQRASRVSVLKALAKAGTPEWVAGAGNPVAGVSANTGGSATGVVEKLDGSEFPWVAARSCSAFFNAS